MFKKAIWISFLFIPVFLALTGCSAKSIPKTEVTTSESVTASPVIVNGNDSGNVQTNGSDATSLESPLVNKIIITGNINMETFQFDETINHIRNMVSQKGGYVENSILTANSKEKNRNFYITIKIPADHYMETRNFIESLGNVRSSQETADDVTDQYYDIESRLKTKKIEEERILDLIEKAIDTKELLGLEERLADIRQSIETFETDIKNIDRLTAYSTINVSLKETAVVRFNHNLNHLPSKMKDSFVKSISGIVWLFETIVIVFAALIVPVCLIGIPCFSTFFIIRKWSRKLKND